MTKDERIKELIAKNNRQGRTIIEQNKKMNQYRLEIHNNKKQIQKMKNEIGELKERIYGIYIR